MADEPDTTTSKPDATVTIRKTSTGEEQHVFLGALPFFPGWEVVTDEGDDRPKRNASADDWRDYVVGRDLADEETAADLNRDQLIALVPEED